MDKSLQTVTSKIVDWLYSLRCRVSGHVWLPSGRGHKVCVRCRLRKKERVVFEFDQLVFPEKEWQTEVDKKSGQFKPCAICYGLFNVELLKDNACSKCTAELYDLGYEIREEP